MDFNSFYISGNRNDCLCKKSCLLLYFICDVNMMSLFSAGQRACPSCTWQHWTVLRRTTPDFVAPCMWPPNSWDLNLVDYTIWSVIQQRVYETRVHDIVGQLGAVADWWCSWSMHKTLACLCLCQRRTFWTYSVTINLFSLYLMNFMLHTMLDAAGDVLRVHYKSMKCDVSFSQRNVKYDIWVRWTFFIHV